jgi:isopentenyl diphosphate isomerase/L-lactate dehydrogenase-like FMN-dependent dehydrogenase
MTMANWQDLRDRARRRLPKIFFDYIDGAAFSEETAAANINDFARWQLNQRALVGVGQRDQSVIYLGVKRTLPFMLGPVGFSGLFAPHGEIQAARAAHKAGVPFCLSNFGITSLEDLRAATDGPIWFQLYVMRDRALSNLFIDRAERAGAEALVVTVDTTVGGIRERDVRNGFRHASHIDLPMALRLLAKPRWCWEITRAGPLRINNLKDNPEYGKGVLEQASRIGRELDASLTWDDLKRIRERWQNKLVIKGILNVADAQRCVDVGADALVVSNHGGRQLDGAPSTISVLPEVVAVVGRQLDVLFDSGVRRGTHVVKALALGAKGVLLGRAYAYALGAAGESGVSELIAMLTREIDVTIGHMGVGEVSRLHALKEEVLRRAFPER